MDTVVPIWTLPAAISTLALTGHVASAIIAGKRLRPRPQMSPQTPRSVTVIRPVCGLDPVEMRTLTSTFRLPHTTEIIFCAARETDRAVPYLRRLMAQRPHANATLMIGTDGPGINPKLDNVRKGWRAASNDWIVIADSNVLMDESYLWNLLSAWRDDVGAVCAPPTAIDGVGLWADVETQFLNGYQGRWQYTADAMGHGFAQGKSMPFRKSLLEQWGGIDALDEDVAEDAATTKVVRRHGYHVRLALQAVPQPLGSRSLMQVWQRQCRWAQLRRQSFPSFYLLEPLTMLLPLLAMAAMTIEDLPIAEVAALACATWIIAEAYLARCAGWAFNAGSILAVLVREVLSPAIWLAGWRVRPFSWRQSSRVVLERQPA